MRFLIKQLLIVLVVFSSFSLDASKDFDVDCSGNTELHNSVITFDLEKIEQTLSRYKEELTSDSFKNFINCRNQDGKTALHLFTEKILERLKQIDLDDVKKMLRKMRYIYNADKLIRDDNGDCPYDYILRYPKGLIDIGETISEDELDKLNEISNYLIPLLIDYVPDCVIL